MTSVHIDISKLKNIGFAYAHNTASDIMRSFNGFSAGRLMHTTTDCVTFFMQSHSSGKQPDQVKTLARIYNEVVKLDAILVYDHSDQGDPVDLCKAIKKAMPNTQTILVNPSRWNLFHGSCYIQNGQQTPENLQNAIEEGLIDFVVTKDVTDLHLNDAAWHTEKTVQQIIEGCKKFRPQLLPSIDALVQCDFSDYRPNIMRLVGLDPDASGKNPSSAHEIAESYHQHHPKIREIENWAYP